MTRFAHPLARDVRATAAVAFGIVVILGIVLRQELDVRSAIDRTQRRTAETEATVAQLAERLDTERRTRDRMVRTDRGSGPGGIRSPHEDLLFEGPTAARSALELVVAADAAGYDRLHYVADETRVVGRFPPESEGQDTVDTPGPASPIRDRIALEEWPLKLTVETDWPGVLDLVGRLVESRPSFAIRSLAFRVREDDQGGATDGLVLDAELATAWLDREGTP